MLNMDGDCGMLFPIDLHIIEILHNLYKLADTERLKYNTNSYLLGPSVR